MFHSLRKQQLLWNRFSKLNTNSKLSTISKNFRISVLTNLFIDLFAHLKFLSFPIRYLFLIRSSFPSYVCTNISKVINYYNFFTRTMFSKASKLFGLQERQNISKSASSILVISSGQLVAFFPKLITFFFY